MGRPKYTLTERQFAGLRDTLKRRRINRFLDENVEAAYAVMVQLQPVRVVALRSGKSVNGVNRVVRELWCIAHGFSKWDLYLNRLSPCAENASINGGYKYVASPSAKEELRCITRSSLKNSGRKGWKISIQRSFGGELHHFVEFIADSKCGGKAKALAAAQSRREEIRRELSQLIAEHRAGDIPLEYVRRLILHRRTRSGDTVLRSYWQAYTPSRVIPFRQRSFSIARYGDEEALRMAIDASREFRRPHQPGQGEFRSLGKLPVGDTVDAS